MRAGARRAAGLFAGVLLLLFCGVCGARAQDADAPIPVPAPSTPLPLKPDPALQAKLQAMIGPYAGKVTLFAHDLGTGQTVAINADTPVPTASVIKLTILYEALEQIRAGKASWDEKLTLTKAEQVPGSGVLLFFDTPLTITLKDAITMMIVMSDNTATNLVIDRLGIQNIDSQIQALGLKNTWLYKRIMLPPTGPMPADQKQFGLGKTTAREMATVLTRFVTCELGPYVGPGAAAVRYRDAHAGQPVLPRRPAALPRRKRPENCEQNRRARPCAQRRGRGVHKDRTSGDVGVHL
jgi:D-alanyl-D-alanine carboxypeptidase